jgi:hypothetical protein
MLIRNFVLTCTAFAALSPVIAHATSERVSAKACAKAFAGSMAAPGGASPEFKLAYRDSVGSALSSFYSTDYTFTLEAHDAKTGAAIARASCSTDYRGVVTAIEVLPLDSKAAALAAGF